MNPNTTVILIRSCRLLLFIPDVRRCGSTVQYKQHRCCSTHLRISGILTIADSVDLRSSSSSIDDDDIDEDDDDDDDCAVDGGGNCNGNGNGNRDVLVIR